MSKTSEIFNVTDGPVGVTVYAAYNSNVRKRMTLAAGEKLRVDRVTPEVRSLEVEGKLKISAVMSPIPDPPEKVTRGFQVDPSVDTYFAGDGYAWPAVGQEPILVDYRCNVRRFVSNEKCAILAPKEPKYNVDLDWWNCDRGPYFRIAKAFEGDFQVAVDVEADGGIAEGSGDDWVGIILVNAANPFHYACVALTREESEDQFAIVLHRNFDVSNILIPEEKIGSFDGPGPHDWKEVDPGLQAVVSYFPRVLVENKNLARFTIRRVGPLVYLEVNDFATESRIIVQDFMVNTAYIALALGRYPSQGSKLQGAVFFNIGVTEES